MKPLRTLALALAALALSASTAGAADAFKVLVFSKTKGYRHDSIPVGIEAIKKLGAENGFTVEASEDAAIMAEDKLKPFQVVVFLSTTGDILDDAQQDEFIKWYKAGHGWVGVHAAADCEYGWPWYGGLVGAWFKRHPAQ
jgi:type 1 glutamine amidotransferase